MRGLQHEHRGPGVGDGDEELVLMADARRILLEPSCSDPQKHLSDLKGSSERIMAWIERGALEVSRRLQAVDTIRSKLEGFQRTPAYSSAKGKAGYYHFSVMLEEADRQLDDSQFLQLQRSAPVKHLLRELRDRINDLERSLHKTTVQRVRKVVKVSEEPDEEFTYDICAWRPREGKASEGCRQGVCDVHPQGPALTLVCVGHGAFGKYL